MPLRDRFDDGSRVLQLLLDGSKIAYAGALEVQITGTQRITKTYYSAGSQLIAIRQFTTPTTSVLYFLHSDHLGSTSLTTDNNGNPLTRQLYDAWGNIRSGGGMPTDIGYTGQRLDSTGLMYYRARYYAQGIGRFVSADTMVPDATNPQAWNRFAYTYNNPLKYSDPSGHNVDCGINDSDCKKRLIAEQLWDKDWLQYVGDQHEAEDAFIHFMDDPGYFASLYADPQAWTTSQEVAALEVFVEYSTLPYNSADSLVSILFDSDTAATLQAAHLHASMGDTEGANSLLAAAGVVGATTIGTAGAGGDTCLQCGTVRPDLAKGVPGGLRIDPDGSSVWCATCIDKGISNMRAGKYVRMPWSAVVDEAKATGVAGPEWTGPKPDHFGIFRGGPGPTEQTSPLWRRLNDFVKSFSPRFFWSGKNK